MEKIIGQDIFIINKYFKLYFKHKLKQYGFNSAEALALLALYDQMDVTHANLPLGFTQEQILAELHYHKSVMTRTMQSLETKAFVKRGEHPTDNRCHLFTLSEQAIAFMPKLIAILQEWNMILLKDVKHLEIVEEEIKKMTENVIAHSIA